MTPVFARVPRPERATWLVAGGVALVTIVVLAGTQLVVNSTQYDIRWFTADVAHTTNTPWHLALLSNVGIVLWGAAACVALTAAMIHRHGPLARMLLGGALLSAWFAADDLLLIHDEHLPRFLGIQDAVSYGVYGLVLLLWLWRCRGALMTGDGLLLLLPALACFAGSNAFDALHLPGELGEEGLKLAGIVFWCAFFIRTAVVSLAPVPRTAGSVRPPTSAPASSPSAPPSQPGDSPGPRATPLPRQDAPATENAPEARRR